MALNPEPMLLKELMRCFAVRTPDNIGKLESDFYLRRTTALESYYDYRRTNL